MSEIKPWCPSCGRATVRPIMNNVWGDRYFECGSCDHVWKIKADRIVRPDETDQYLPTPKVTLPKKKVRTKKPKPLKRREIEAVERQKKIEGFAALSRKEQKAAIKGA